MYIMSYTVECLRSAAAPRLHERQPPLQYALHGSSYVL
jgi:hypothetical protein